MEMTHDIKRLKEIYSSNSLVPFVGAGLSRPFNIPDWKNLLLKLNDELIDDFDIRSLIKEDIDLNKYWEAVEMIKEYSFKDESYINSEVVNIINDSMEKNISSVDNNYVDLNNLKVPYYLTTNYDNLLSSHIDGQYQTTILKNWENSMQSVIMDKTAKRIFHLHGDSANPGSIVLSKKSYDDMYSSEKYRELFSFFKNGYTFLFLGFSFSDKYIIELMMKNSDIFNSHHYIVLPNPTKELRHEYMNKYKLIVIGYEVKDISDSDEHVRGIREILESIGANQEIENF
ncbi:SIR2 family protein [Clostridium perfringens]|nr:SIR2 family protein [Clostridium perfringens]